MPYLQQENTFMWLDNEFLNQARLHSQPKAGCGRVPGLLKLFYEKCSLT